MSVVNPANPKKSGGSIPSGGKVPYVDWNDITNRPDLSTLSYMKGIKGVLLADKWENGDQTFVFTGISPNPEDQLICIIPDEDSKISFHNAKISVKETHNELVFHADVVPDTDMTVYIYLINAAELGEITTGEWVWWSPEMTASDLPKPYIVTVSDEYSSYRGYKALDGVLSSSSYWDSNGNNSTTGTIPWIKIDFGDSSNIFSGIKIMNNTVSSAAKVFSVEGSNNDKDWNLVYHSDGTEYPSLKSDTYYEYMFSGNFNYRYWRLTVEETSNPNGHHMVNIKEIQFYKWKEDKL